MAEEVREGLKYAETHEWVKVDGNKAVVGISDHAQNKLTDIVYVELPEEGDEIEKDDELCIVESVKSVSEIYSPVSGTIARVNKTLEDSPELINKKPYDDGWLVEIELTDKDELKELMDARAYKENLEE